MSENAHNPNAAMIRNIIVGVTTSVLGAGALYFLGINKSGGSASSKSSFLETKEATTKGWKSYVTDDNIYYKNTISIFNDLQRNKQLDDYRDNLLKEMHKFQDDLSSILKDQDLDNSFITMIKRRQDVEKELEEKFKDYVGNVKTLMDNNNSPQNEKQQKLAQEDQKWANTTKGMIERSITEIEDLSKALNEKYGQAFTANDLLAYQAYKKGTLNSQNTNNQNANNQAGKNAVSAETNNDAGNNTSYSDNSNNNNNPINNNNTSSSGLTAGMFGGEWTNEGGSLYFDNNGFSWQWNNGNATSEGSWRVYNNQLSMYVTKGYNTGYSWVFNLYNLSPNSFTMQLTTNSSYTFHCVKDNGR